MLQKNDYNSDKCSLTSSVRLTWFGHPGDTPVDIRARPFIVNWDSSAELTELEMEKAKKDSRVVARWKYYCRGACSMEVNPHGETERGEPGENEDLTSEGPLLEEQVDSDDDQPKLKRHHECPSSVKLVVCRLSGTTEVIFLTIFQIEISADDLTHAKIWQYQDHLDSYPENLIWSRRLRNVVQERFRCVGSKVSSIMRGKFLCKCSFIINSSYID